jgi:putative MFS transporter
LQSALHNGREGLGIERYRRGAQVGRVAARDRASAVALLGTWAGVYAFTPEVYPTSLRASGMGTAGAIARVGGLLAPSLIAPMMATNCNRCGVDILRRVACL